MVCKPPITQSHKAGFTLVELLVVILIIGVLAAILAPAWQGFVARQKLNKAQSQAYQALQAARSNAITDKVTWVAGFREQMTDGTAQVQWSVYPVTTHPNQAFWDNFDPGVRLDSETNLPQTDGVYQALFNHTGCPASTVSHDCLGVPPGRVTFSSPQGGKTKRCVIISTILGAMRLATEQPQPNNGKYCY